MNLILPKGELKKRTRQQNILADALKISDINDLSDVELITLKQWATEQAYNEAWNTETDPSRVKFLAEKLLSTKFNKAKEFVQVRTDRIQIGLNDLEIDDRSIYKAIALMTQVDELSSYSTTEFGVEHELI